MAPRRPLRLASVVLVLALFAAAACSSEDDGDEAAGTGPAAEDTVATGPTTTAIGSTGSSGSSGAATPADVGTVTLSMTGCELTRAVDVTPAGAVTIALANRTDVVGWLSVLELDDASRFEDLEVWVAEEVELAKAGERGLGHPSYVVPLSDVVVDAGGSGSLEVTLGAGAYAIVCGRFYQQANEIRPSDVFPLSATRD